MNKTIFFNELFSRSVRRLVLARPFEGDLFKKEGTAGILPLPPSSKDIRARCRAVGFFFASFKEGQIVQSKRRALEIMARGGAAPIICMNKNKPCSKSWLMDTFIKYRSQAKEATKTD